mmetsp:Transcript_10995/g.16190  ORF Transcript_10995/g.16190 Transcript_10995/m.16190 type:complete len:234 (+) Transcript_10995:167-868(+)
MDSRYSFSLTTFSPSGKLVQIEYALKAVQAGSTSLAIKTPKGVVLATEKKLPSQLIDSSSLRKISTVTDHVGLVYSGMGPDARVIVNKARKEAEAYYRVYKERIPVVRLVARIATIMQEFTQSGGVRPFGVSLLVGGYDDEGSHLYQVDPSGSYWAWKACAIGKNMENGNTFLEKRYSDNMAFEDAVHTAILTLKEGFDGKITSKNIEIGVVDNNKQFKVLTPDELQTYIDDN